VHVSGADGTDFTVSPAKSYEGRAALGCHADCDETLFGDGGMFRVRGNMEPCAEHGFNLDARQTVLLTFGTVAVVPI